MQWPWRHISARQVNPDHLPFILEVMPTKLSSIVSDKVVWLSLDAKRRIARLDCLVFKDRQIDEHHIHLCENLSSDPDFSICEH